MAVLTTTTKMNYPVPDGQTKVRVYNVTVASQSATDEWIATGGEEVIAVLGVSPLNGTAGLTPNLSIVLNARGTGATAGANPGDLGIETADTTDVIVDITVAYR
jgi:hypothetical protein